jgi:hypothetical protein
MVKPRKIPKIDLTAELNKSASLDENPLPYGKYQGQTPCWIAEHDPQYIIWMYETVSPERRLISKDLYEACRLDEDEENDNSDLRELDGLLRFHK